jgi:hypothetical protein
MKEPTQVRPSDQDEQDLVVRTDKFIESLTERLTVLATAQRAAKRGFRGRASDAATVVRWLESVVPATADLPELEDRRSSLLDAWKSVATQQFLEIEAELRDACRAEGWQVDGQWPDLYVEYGIRIHLEEKDRSASVGHERLRLATPTAILAALRLQVPALVPKTFTPAGFIIELARAYDELSNGLGGQQRLLDVYRVFVIRSQVTRFWRNARADLFTAIDVDQFRARIARTLIAGATKVPDGRELRLLPPLDSKDAVFIHQPSEGRYAFVGRIEFAKQAEGLVL